MDKRIKGRQRRRTLIQTAWTVLTNGYLVGFTTGKIFSGPTKALCVPGLSCYSCPGALGSCPIGALQGTLAGVGRNFAYVLGWLFAFGALFGRVVCGFLCPFGWVQDLLYKIPMRKKLRSLPGERILRKIRYALLGVFVVGLPLLIRNVGDLGEPWFCKWICPSGMFMAGLPLAAINPAIRSAVGALFTWKAAILVGVAVLSVKLYRPFCRYLCPLGAVYGKCNGIALMRYQVDEKACISCGACQRACPLDIPVMKRPNSPDCVRCGRCMEACPAEAIRWNRAKSCSECKKSVSSG